MATIKGTDIVEGGHLNEAIRQAELLTKAYNELDAAVLKANKDLSAQVKGNRGNSAQEIEQLNVALQKSITIKNAATKVDKEKATLEQRLIGLRSEEMKQNEVLKVQISEQRKENKLLAKETLGLTNAYDKLVRDTNKAQDEFKRLAAQFGVNSSQAKKAKSEFEKFDNELRQINQHARDGKRDVGRYGIALKGAAGGLKRMAGALGLVGGVQLFARVVKDAFNVIKNFDQATANLSSVLGVSKESMSALTEQAKQLGATTKFTASNVAELQLEFAKLGFTQKEIENVTEATLQLAAASGTDLGNAAAIAGSTLRAFGLDTSETQRVVDVMAKSFSASSLDIDKFKAAMGSVAPVAKGAGFTIEQTTSLLGTLTNAGIDASTAGTGLRNIFLELTKKGISFEDAMNKISTSSNKNATSLDLFGKRGAALGTILAENQGETDKLTESLKRSAGAAGEMADKQLDTLGGALDILRSSWEGAILEMNEATGTSDGLKDLIILLADAIPYLVKGVGQMAGGLASLIKKITGLKSAWGSAFESQRNFSDALADTVDSLLAEVPLIGKLTDALLRTKVVIIDLTDEQKRNNAVRENALKVGRDILALNKDELGDIPILIDALTDENTTREEKNKIIAKLNEDYPEQLKNIDLETASTEQLIAVKKELIKTMLTQAVEERKAEERAKVFSTVLDLQISKIGIADKARQAELDRRIQEQLAGLKLIDDVANKVLGEMGESINNMNLESPIDSVSSEVTKLTAQIAEIKGQLQGLDPSSEEAQRLQKLLNKKLNLLSTFEKQRVDLIKDGLDEEGELTGTTSSSSGSGKGSKSADKKIKKLKEKDFDPFKDDTFEKFDPDKDFQNTKKQLEINLKLLELEMRKQGKTEEEIQKALSEEKLRNLKLERDRALELYGSSNQNFLDADLALRKEIDRRNAEQEALEEKRAEDRKKRQEENFKALQKSADEAMKLIELFANSRISEIDRLIEKQKQEVSASENEINRLQELASNGNNDAAESLKAEKIKQAKDKQEIENLEKKKKNLLITIAALNQANQFFQSGDLDGFKKASGNVQSFINSLPTFYEGTETTIADALGSPHLNTSKDAYLARLDGKEGVLTGSKMDALRSVGLRTTDQITNAAIKAQTNGMTMSALTSRRLSNYENREIVGAVERIEKAVKGIDITSTHIDVKNLMEVIKKGNTTTRNDYNQSKFKI